MAHSLKIPASFTVDAPLRWRLATLLAILILPGVLAHPPALEGAEDAVLRVGVTSSPPFSYRMEDGEWRGLTVDLWRGIAERMDLPYEFRHATVRELVSGLAEGEFDIGAAAIVVTAERERVMDFSHSFYSGGLSVATKPEVGSVTEAIVRSLFTLPFLVAVGGLLALLLGVGFVVWMAERHRNREQFGGSIIEGVGSGFWWSAVTMTTVGYGDKYPMTKAGKFIGFIWMFSSLLLVSVFTGAIASALTVSSIQPRISGFQDLYGARVGVVAGSHAQAYLHAEGVAHREYPDTASGLEAVATGRLDGFVNDAALLRHIVRSTYPGELTVIEQEFQPGFYALGLRNDLLHLQRINLTLLELTQSEEWQAMLRRHIGQ